MTLPYVIEPGSFQAFEGEPDELDKCKEWGLLSDKAVKPKAYVYKKGGESLSCRIVGFVDDMTAVIAFDDGRKHCIHPSFLKEMQAASYTQRIGGAIGDIGREEAEAEEPADAAADAPKAKNEGGGAVSAQDAAAATAKTEPAEDAIAADKPAAKADKSAGASGKGKGKAPKLELPVEKVKMTATVREFTTVPNHFTEEEDEVVIYGDVSILEPELAVGDAWSSHSATLKKLELAVGDTIAFEAKIVAKKLSKHPVPYKINNPAKIVKQ